MPVLIRTTGVEQYLDGSGGAYIKTLILGEPSAGKTRWSSFFPDPIYAAWENGLMSVADRRVPYALITATSDMESLLTQLEAEARKAPEQRRFKTVIVDTIDAAQRVTMAEILREQRHDAMELRDWGLMAQRMNVWLQRLLRLPMHVVVLSHTKTSRDGDGPSVSEPGLQGSLKETISADFDLVGHMATFWESVNGERVLSRAIKWHPEPSFPILKDRSGQLPKYTPVTFSDADFEVLREKMFGGAYFESLPESEDIDVLPDASTGPAPVPPAPGGPVAVATPVKDVPAVRKPVKKSTVPAAKKAVAPVQEAVPAGVEEVQLPEPVTPEPEEVPVAPEPVVASTPEPTPEPIVEPTPEQAQALVTEQLGAVEMNPAVAEVRSPDLVGIACGTPALNKTPKAEGCGKDLGAESMDIVNIAVFQMHAQLCQDCFQAARKAGKHKATVSA